MNTQLNELRRLMAQIDSLVGSVEVTGSIREARQCAEKARSATVKAVKIAAALDAQPPSLPPELWAVHAQGPDELYAAFSREDAEKHAAELNTLTMPEGISVGAVVMPSPWPAAEHWMYLAEQEREHGDSARAALAQPSPAPELDYTHMSKRMLEELAKLGKCLVATADLERLTQERDAALAKVAELEGQSGIEFVYDSDELVAVPRGLLGAACHAIDKKRDAPRTIAKLREYARGISAPVAQAGHVPEGYTLVPEHAGVDAIVTALYRRFKDWSARGFGPEDVTWCEVKADLLALVAQAGQVLEATASAKALVEIEAKKYSLNAAGMFDSGAPAHGQTIAVQELLAGFDDDEAEDHWEAIMAYSDLRASNALFHAAELIAAAPAQGGA
ncbi:hypothetical protein [Pseudomonas nitroreducens]|uniref:hypothetical protein n=1 Tax=Pseudomonas nitroreducens TaxID=46680 RepID=UPI0004640A9C|nr:hypothetical protein [Pseudomonas nitroreducens]